MTGFAKRDFIHAVDFSTLWIHNVEKSITELNWYRKKLRKLHVDVMHLKWHCKWA